VKRSIAYDASRSSRKDGAGACPDRRKDSTLRREYEAAALRDFDPAEDRLGSILLKKGLVDIDESGMLFSLKR